MSKTPKDSAAVDKQIADLGWTTGKTLGQGAFGLVKLVTRNTDGVTAACKIMKKPTTAKDRKLIDMEYKIMTSMNHPYIVRCYDAIENETSVFLFLELMDGGELFDKIIEMSKFSESMAADVSYKLLGALNYMHARGIIHRDLKPENMLIAKKGDLSAVKLTDFGLSKMIDEQSTIMKTACGTPAYVAPEVLNNRGLGYDHKVDVWSMGVIIYILLCGFPPFYGNNDTQLFSKIKRGDYKFLKPYWDPISADAKDFVRKMLVVDPKQRASIDELLKHPWVAAAAKAEAAKQDHEVAAKQDELDLRKGGDYHIKETEAKLAEGTRSLFKPLSKAVALASIAKVIRRRKLSVASTPANDAAALASKLTPVETAPPAQPAQPAPTAPPPQQQQPPPAQQQPAKEPAKASADDVDVQVDKTAGGGCCVVL